MDMAHALLSKCKLFLNYNIKMLIKNNYVYYQLNNKENKNYRI
jgi:hypothetical protein